MDDKPRLSLRHFVSLGSKSTPMISIRARGHVYNDEDQGHHPHHDVTMFSWYKMPVTEGSAAKDWNTRFHITTQAVGSSHSDRAQHVS